MNSKNRFKIMPFHEWRLQYLLAEGSIREQCWTMFPGRSVIVYDRMLDMIWIEVNNKSYSFLYPSSEIQLFHHRLKIATHKWMRHSEVMAMRDVVHSKSAPRKVSKSLIDLLITDYEAKYIVAIKGRFTKLFRKNYGYNPT